MGDQETISAPEERLRGAPGPVGRPRHVAVVIPCFNEEPTVGQVVEDFKAELPDASVVVFDNNSTDETAAVAESAGARVIPESRQGKGYVVASMLEKVDAARRRTEAQKEDDGGTGRVGIVR